MLEQIIIAAVVGAFISLDVTHVGQFSVSRPLVVCTAAGGIAGDPVTGFCLGVFLELLCADMLPLGVVVPLDPAIMAVTGSFLLFMFKSMSLAIAGALAAAVIFRRYDIWFKKQSLMLSVFINDQHFRPDTAVTLLIAANILITVLRNAAFLAIALAAAVFAGRWVTTQLPPYFMQGCVLMDGMLPYFGLIVAINAFKMKDLASCFQRKT